ncbi:MAG: ATP-binding cassette domain-containing protein [Bacilli bacterium]
MFSNLSYTFKSGKIYVIVGYSGSGKSTFLHIVANFIPKNSGKIKYKNKLITKNDVTLVLQHPYFLGDLRIIDNLKISSLFRHLNNRKIRQKYTKALQISHILQRRANVCSGGEKARANILRGIIERKHILLIDEPTAHLDFKNSQIVAKLLSELSANKIVIVTTHQPSLFKSGNTIFLRIKNGVFHEDNNII